MTRQDNFTGYRGFNKNTTKEPARTQPEKITIDSTRLQERLGCRVGRSAVQTITTGTPTLVQWTTEVYDRSGTTGSLHDTSTNNSRITIPSEGRITGQWLFHAHVIWATGGTGIRTLQILRNGAKEAISEMPAIAGGTMTMDLIVLVNDPNPGSYFEVRVEHSQGSNLDVDGEDSYFEAIHLW